MEKNQTHRNSRQNKAACSSKITAGTWQGWLHPAPKHTILYISWWEKVTSVKSQTLRTGSLSPSEQAHPLCFNKEHNKGIPAPGGKTRVWLTRGPLHIGKGSPCAFKMSLRVSVLYIVSGQLRRTEDVRSGDAMKAKHICGGSPFNWTSLNQLTRLTNIPHSLSKTYRWMPGCAECL